MHLSVSALSKIVNSGVLKSAASLAIPLQWMANKLSLFSKNYGGMLVNVTGRDSNGEPVSAEWSLSAQGEAGPHIPILACLIIIRKLAKDKQLIKGAHVCTGLVSLSEFNAEFEKLGIQTQKKLVNLSTPPFEIALGESFYKLPEITQLIHFTAPSRLLSGEVNVEGARNPLTKMIAYIFRMPTNSKATPFQTSIELDDTGTENWARHFPLRCMRSRMGNPDPKNSTIDESFGLFRFTLQLDAHESGIDMHLLSGRFINIKLPSFFLPKINATERANADKHLFDVEVGLPLIGRLVHYSGWLEVKD